MAVRFYCEKCKKPLEVDDREAGKKVLCFYCKSRTNVPMQSSSDLAEVDVNDSEISLTPIIDDQPVKTDNSSLIGKAGFIAGIILILTVFVFYGLIFSRVLEVVRADGFKEYPAEKQTQRVSEVVQDCIKSQKMLVLGGASFLIAIIGSILSISGLLKKGRKIAPAAGLIINGGFLLFVLATVLSSRYQ